MKKLAIITLAIASTITTANAAAYKVTIAGKSEMVCSASAAAWKLYNVAKETTLSNARIERQADDSKASTACAAERQARAAQASAESPNG